ncbi:alpha/beta hydrolase-fold protein [Pollutibacter soli]|uniref:alpha/beta hydrolase-fold protein n=1 Tax=Pollutibacter soli TaxID=3034157 RepID=UPI003013EE13
MNNKYLIVLFLMLVSSNLFAQEKKEIIIADVVSVKSKILQEERTAWVYNPDKEKGTRIYPVIFVLDGEIHFKSVVAMVDYLSGANIIPQMIVVGILHTNRIKDLTPAIKNTVIDGREENSGGGDKFMSFIESELLPVIQSTYPAAPYRILMGHSLGGLTVMNTLVHHKDLFNAYVSIDASLWWDNHSLLNESKAALTANNFADKKLFLAIANRMEKGVDTSAVQQDTTENTELIRYNMQLIRSIKDNLQNNLVFDYKYYADDNHNSVSFIAEYDALRYIFSYYKFDLYPSFLENKNLRLDTLLDAHYKSVSRQLGYIVKPPESLVNGLAYYSLNTKQYTKAEYLFRMNVSSYPKSSNVYDGLGDFYSATNDKINAVVWYKKALEIAEVPETRNKLKVLENKF